MSEKKTPGLDGSDDPPFKGNPSEIQLAYMRGVRAGRHYAEMERLKSDSSLVSILMWDKPQKLRSPAEHVDMHQADGAPPGTYAPNMSAEDEMRWKAKFVGTKLGFPQVEIRRNGVVIILSHKGYKYGSSDFRQTPENLAQHAENKKRFKWKGDLDQVVHISMNGSQAWSMKEYEEFQRALKEGWEALESKIGA